MLLVQNLLRAKSLLSMTILSRTKNSSKVKDLWEVQNLLRTENLLEVENQLLVELVVLARWGWLDQRSLSSLPSLFSEEKKGTLTSNAVINPRYQIRTILIDMRIQLPQSLGPDSESRLNPFATCYMIRIRNQVILLANLVRASARGGRASTVCAGYTESPFTGARSRGRRRGNAVSKLLPPMQTPSPLHTLCFR